MDHLPSLNPSGHLSGCLAVEFYPGSGRAQRDKGCGQPPCPSSGTGTGYRSAVTNSQPPDPDPGGRNPVSGGRDLVSDLFFQEMLSPACSPDLASPARPLNSVENPSRHCILHSSTDRDERKQIPHRSFITFKNWLSEERKAFGIAARLAGTACPAHRSHRIDSKNCSGAGIYWRAIVQMPRQWLRRPGPGWSWGRRC